MRYPLISKGRESEAWDKEIGSLRVSDARSLKNLWASEGTGSDDYEFIRLDGLVDWL